MCGIVVLSLPAVSRSLRICRENAETAPSFGCTYATLIQEPVRLMLSWTGGCAEHMQWKPPAGRTIAEVSRVPVTVKMLQSMMPHRTRFHSFISARMYVCGVTTNSHIPKSTARFMSSSGLWPHITVILRPSKESKAMNSCHIICNRYHTELIRYSIQSLRREITVYCTCTPRRSVEEVRQEQKSAELRQPRHASINYKMQQKTEGWMPKDAHNKQA